MEHEKGEKYVSLQTPQTPRVEWYLGSLSLAVIKKGKIFFSFPAWLWCLYTTFPSLASVGSCLDKDIDSPTRRRH